MANRFTPGCCCGCTQITSQLFPDFHYPVVTRCFKQVREIVATSVLTTQLTQTWVDGVLTNNTATLENSTTTEDETIESITQNGLAGKFDWTFPTVTVRLGLLLFSLRKAK